MTSLKCVTCPTGQVFNQDVQKCVYQTPAYTTNPNVAPNLIYGDTPRQEWIQTYSQIKATNPSLRDCSAPSPYYNGNKCISCPA